MTRKPICIDLFCGLGGFSEGFLLEGWDCIGFDIERHDYGTGGYPAQLVIQDVLTLHGSQFKDAAVIVASPPCQEYSYMAMPWSRAKKIAEEYRSGVRDVKKLTELFDACFRIAAEAGAPVIVENVRGAQPWVGPAQAEYGSFMLWGDIGVAGGNIIVGNRVELLRAPSIRGRKNSGGSWFNIAHNTQSGCGQNPDGRKLPGNNGPRRWEDRDVQRLCDANRDTFGWSKDSELRRNSSSSSSSRKAASAQIAKIPLALSLHIARCFKPQFIESQQQETCV